MTPFCLQYPESWSCFYAHKQHFAWNLSFCEQKLLFSNKIFYHCFWLLSVRFLHKFIIGLTNCVIFCLSYFYSIALEVFCFLYLFNCEYVFVIDVSKMLKLQFSDIKWISKIWKMLNFGKEMVLYLLPQSIKFQK